MGGTGLLIQSNTDYFDITLMLTLVLRVEYFILFVFFFSHTHHDIIKELAETNADCKVAFV